MWTSSNCIAGLLGGPSPRGAADRRSTRSASMSSVRVPSTRSSTCGSAAAMPSSRREPAAATRGLTRCTRWARPAELPIARPISAGSLCSSRRERTTHDGVVAACRVGQAVVERAQRSPRRVLPPQSGARRPRARARAWALALAQRRVTRVSRVAKTNVWARRRVPRRGAAGRTRGRRRDRAETSQQRDEPAARRRGGGGPLRPGRRWSGGLRWEASRAGRGARARRGAPAARAARGKWRRSARMVAATIAAAPSNRRGGRRAAARPAPRQRGATRTAEVSALWVARSGRTDAASVVAPVAAGQRLSSGGRRARSGARRRLRRRPDRRRRRGRVATRFEGRERVARDDVRASARGAEYSSSRRRMRARAMDVAREDVARNVASPTVSRRPRGERRRRAALRPAATSRRS